GGRIATERCKLSKREHEPEASGPGARISQLLFRRRAGMKKKSKAKKSVKTLPAKRVSGRKTADVRGGSNVLNMKHETVKSIANNLRG
ncbi:MAG TPA: hypothetical protein VJA66_08830, partial [Thermoanaerobaculia bacterium]